MRIKNAIQGIYERLRAMSKFLHKKAPSQRELSAMLTEGVITSGQKKTAKRKEKNYLQFWIKP